MEATPNLTSSSPVAKRLSWITPWRWLFALLALEIALFASEQYQWLVFNDDPCWTVLIAIAVVGVGLLLMVGWFVIWLMLRRTVQFHLTGMLLLIVVLAIPCAWFAHVRQRVVDESLATSWVMKRDGARASVDFSSREDMVFRSRTVIGPKPAADATTLRHVRAGRGAYWDLKWLRQWLGDEFFDRGLWYVRFGDRFPAGTAEHRSATPEGLYAGEQFDLTDDEMIHLRGLHNLAQLSISSRKITDAGLRPLYSLQRLKGLTLVTPNVTPEGITELRRNLPGCEVVIYDDVVEPRR